MSIEIFYIFLVLIPNVTARHHHGPFHGASDINPEVKEDTKQQDPKYEHAVKCDDKTDTKHHEAKCDVKADTKKDESKVEKKKEECKCEKKHEEPKCYEKHEEPKCDKKHEESKCDEKHEEPKCDKKHEEPKYEKKHEEPKCEKKHEEPKCEKQHEEPKCEKKHEEPKCEKHYEEPKCEKKHEEPKCEKKHEEPKYKKTPEEPKCEKKHEEPKYEKKEEKPKCEKKEEVKPKCEKKEEEKPKCDKKQEQPKHDEKKTDKNHEEKYTKETTKKKFDEGKCAEEPVKKKFDEGKCADEAAKKEEEECKAKLGTKEDESKCSKKHDDLKCDKKGGTKHDDRKTDDKLNDTKLKKFEGKAEPKHENPPDVVTIGKKNFKKQLLVNICGASELVYEKFSERLFFAYTGTDASISSRAYYDMNKKVLVQIPGVFKSRATAADAKSGDVYFGSNDGLYQYRPKCSNVTNIGFRRFSIKKLIMKNDKMVMIAGCKRKIYTLEPEIDYTHRVYISRRIGRWEDVKDADIDSKKRVHIVVTDIGLFCLDTKGNAIINSDLTDVDCFVQKGNNMFGVVGDEMYLLNCHRGTAKKYAKLYFEPQSMIFIENEAFVSTNNKIYHLYGCY